MNVFQRSPAWRSGWRSLVVAVVLVALASLVSKALSGSTNATLIMPYYGTVALSLWLGGVAGGLFATVLSILAFGGLVLGPPGVWSLTSNDIPRIATFVFLAVLLTVLSRGRDRVEADLRASERRLRTMLSTANEGVWLVDRQGQTQFLNDRMAEILGTTAGDIAGRSAFDFVYPEDIETAQAYINAILSGEPSEFEFRLRRQNGAPVWVRIGTSPVRSDRGRVVGILGLFTDMTERRRSEAALNQANERFALAVDAVQSLIYDWDVRSGEVSWSGGLQPLLGYRPEEAESHASVVDRASSRRAVRATRVCPGKHPAGRPFSGRVPDPPPGWALDLRLGPGAHRAR